MHEEENEQLQRWGGRLFVSSLLIILTITLFPYDFFFSDIVHTSNDLFRLVKITSLSELIEFLANILLFFPLGFGFACLAQTKRSERSSRLWVVALAAGFCLSCTIEVLQVFLPARFVSLSDVLANTIGSCFGALSFGRYDRQTLPYLAALFETTREIFTAKILATSFFGYAAIMFLLSVPLQQKASLSNWDDSFPLVVGNEHSGNRPWQGSVFRLQLRNTAIAADEVAHAFSQHGPFASLKGPLLASYRLGEENIRYHDETGHLPELIWRGKPLDMKKERNTFLSAGHWLETINPAASLTHKIQETSQFTLSTTVATADLTQTGPARIVSLSADPYQRNFTLGQEGKNLVFRLRTPLTGENGETPELIVPNIFVDTDPHLFVLTYDGSVLRLYVDGLLHPHALEISSGAIFFSQFFLLDAYNMRGYKILYYAFVFVPLACLLAVGVKSLRA